MNGGNKLEIDFNRKEGDHRWDLLHNAHVLVNDREMYVAAVSVDLEAGSVTRARLSIDVQEFKRFLTEHADLTLSIEQYGQTIVLDKVTFYEGGPGTQVEFHGGPKPQDPDSEISGKMK